MSVRTRFAGRLRSGRSRSLAIGLIGLVLAASAAVDARPAAPAPPSPGTAATNPPSTPPSSALVAPELSVTAIDPAELRPGGTVTITGSVSTGTEALTSLSIVASRTSARRNTRSEIEAWLAPPPDAATPRVLALAAAELGPLGAGESQDFAVSIDAATAGLRASAAAAGPYGLLLELRGAPQPPPDVPAGRPDSVTQSRGFLVWSPETSIAPVSLGLVTPLPSFDADPRTGLIDPGVLERESLPDGSLTRAVAAATALPGTWTVDPLLLASAGADAAGPGTRDWLRGLAAARGDREAAVDTWGRPDPDLLAASEQDTRLRELLDRVAAEPAAGSWADPAETLGGAVRRDITIATPQLRAEGLASVAAVGHAVIIADAAVPLADAELPFTPALREDLPTAAGPVRALITDSTLEASAGGALRGDPLALTTLLAQFAATALQRPNDPRAVGILLGDLATADPAAATVLGTALSSSSFVTPITVETWLAWPVAGQLRTLPPLRDATVTPTPTDVASAVERMTAACRLVTDLGEAVTGPQLLVDSLDLRMASAVATSLPAVEQLRSEVLAQTDDWQTRVRLIPGSSITLAASTAEIRRTIVNETENEVTLRVDVVSRSPRLRVSEQGGTVTIPPGEQVVALIPVEAVSNGRAQLILRLVTPAGRPWGEPTELEVRVATGAETGALAVTAVLITIVFVLGTVRTIRRNRRGAEPARIAP